MKNRFLSFLLIFILAFTFGNVALAQSNDLLDRLSNVETQEEFDIFLENLSPEDVEELFGINPLQDTSSNSNIEGTVSCFDYYEFGSVSAKPFSEIMIVSPGQSLDLGLEITNNNFYPVVDIEVYVRVFRSQENFADAKNNADHVVDQYKVVDGMSLLAGEKKRVSFNWNVPQHVIGGDYRLATFVASSERYNLNGLSFTDDITGNSINFSVIGNESGVYFDKNTVLVNENPHYFVSSIQRVPANKVIDLETEVVNTTDQDQKVSISWTNYVWDSLNEDNIISEEKESVIVPANSKKTVYHKLSHSDKSAYLIVPELSFEDTKSFLNIRFAREGNDYPRINFPGVDKYPLSEEANFFVCLHNVGVNEDIDNVTYTADFIDGKGRVFHKYEYNGKVSSAMMGLVDSFSVSRGYSTFSIKSTLLHNGEIIDEDILEYNCESLSSDLCIDDSIDMVKWAVVVLVLLLILISLGYILHKKYPEEPENI
ncbi:MAG: hypothetical protein MRY49_01985 [Candidatus Pacebacteria bacterium]|nr:hypothetical protein [Candidatus Paceibacterota bacterium]